MSKISLKHSGGNVVSLNSPTSAPTSADVAFKLPNADGSAGQFMKTDGSGNFSFANSGITMADMWRINADFTASGSSLTDITANLERIDSYGFGQLGTGMTQSSGVFSFPSTGIYHINFHLMCQSVYGEVDYHFAYILTTTDNSNYNNAALTVQEAQGTDHRYSMNVNFIFDVTNTSTHKVKFANYASRDDQKCFGQTNQTETSFTFLRLGDT